MRAGWNAVETLYPVHPLRRHFVRCLLPVEMCDGCRMYVRETR